MGQSGAADQHVRRVRVIQRRQNSQLGQQLGIVVTDAQAQGLHLLLKVDARLDRRQCKVTHGARVLDFSHQTVFDHADAALAVTQFKLH